MLVILTVEPQGVNPLHCVKRLFDPNFSDPPLLPQPPINLLIVQSLRRTLCTCSAWVFGGWVFFWRGRVHVIGTGPISTVHTEG
ncbi:unnamed protein product [Staurois parvus]|uniref:Uncharacterized protein n=1 Tax=Staurois parvus TaxID=386267 RepID=A0ABN9G8G2_9NEOB|nr:unnamed protein product [Staurois parvus]